MRPMPSRAQPWRSGFAITDSLERGEVIGRAMAKAFEKHGLQSKTYVSHVNREGAKRVD